MLSYHGNYLCTGHQKAPYSDIDPFTYSNSLLQEEENLS